MAATFVVVMNRVDVVELVVDLDVDLVDVDLAVSLCDGPRSVLFSFGLVAPTSVLFTFGPDFCFIFCWPRPVLLSFWPGPAPFCFTSFLVSFLIHSRDLIISKNSPNIEIVFGSGFGPLIFELSKTQNRVFKFLR